MEGLNPSPFPFPEFVFHGPSLLLTPFPLLGGKSTFLLRSLCARKCPALNEGCCLVRRRGFWCLIRRKCEPLSLPVLPLLGLFSGNGTASLLSP